MAAAFTIVWTPAGGAAVTLADVAARHTAEIQGPLGGVAAEQVSRLFRGANPARFLRGNVAGQFVFVSAKAAADRGAMAAYFKTQYGYLNHAGALVVTIDATTLTMAGATLTGVEAVRFEGVRWPIKYTFGITTIT